ncbi:glycosyltransferase [Rhizorhabdus phycosphaerae]|uniref:glycosyltransferase n=1 Tax=Rhizorhabdus phycosphaerae TaxID=2711156 RepID=UPI0013ECF7C7|nr:nucleotide disphospho-sugar-binding domain-containing protein [Rhizorhabdus phycosphaerae]
MGHYAIVAPPLAGHVNPLVALGETLIDRGHRVSFLLREDAASLLGEARIAPVILKDAAPGDHDRLLRSFGRPHQLLATQRTIAAVAAWAEQLCRQAPALLRQIGATMVIADQMEVAGPLVAQIAGLPCVVVATALPTDREPGIPPIYLGWNYHAGPFGPWRNRGGYRVVDWLMRPVAEVLRRHADAHGIDVADAAGDRCTTLYQAVSSIDFPRRRPSSTMHHVGPLRRDVPAEPPARHEGQAPLIFCSFGSLQGNRPDLFARIAEACSTHGAHLVIAHGGLLSEEAEKALSGMAEVHAFVPQRRILEQAAVAITHGGFNTVLDALSFGVPLLALPMAFEQHATAARIRYRGVGITLPPTASTARLAMAIGGLLTEDRYRQAAAVVQREIGSAGGVARAADIIEREEVRCRIDRAAGERTPCAERRA